MRKEEASQENTLEAVVKKPEQSSGKKRRKKKKKGVQEVAMSIPVEDSTPGEKAKKEEKKPRSRKRKLPKEGVLGMDDRRLRAYGINPKKFKHKVAYQERQKNANGDVK